MNSLISTVYILYKMLKLNSIFSTIRKFSSFNEYKNVVAISIATFRFDQFEIFFE